MTKNPFAEAFAAVVGGIITVVTVQMAFGKFDLLDPPLIFYGSIGIIVVFVYIAGIIEAHVFGFLFPVVLILFGAYLHNWRLIISGAIALVVFLAGVIRTSEGYS